MVVITSEKVTLLTGHPAEQITRLAERARTPAEFNRLIELIQAQAPVAWRPFGWDGTENGGRVPHSALGAAPDPAHLMAEPVMNSFDALFELAMALKRLGAAPMVDPQSPREAAHLLYDVPADGLATWDARKGSDRKLYEALARLTIVKLLRGSRAATPTVSFRDHGIGQHPADFWTTVLSLQLGNKAEVPYTAGQYGHGAGMLLAFTNGGQIMISRRHPKLLGDSQEDYAGLVLVRKRMPSETGRGQPHYECLVSDADNNPFAVSPRAMTNPQWHGLQRTCIDYELPTHAYQAIYDSYDRFLPAPPLPYELVDERDS